MNPEIGAFLRGGLGNQLFIYAAARRLAYVTGGELVLDAVNGFSRDSYCREYSLQHFNICGRVLGSTEYTPYTRLRRRVQRLLASRYPISGRSYIQEDSCFMPELLSLRPNATVWLEGYWQNEMYFRDIRNVLFSELEIITQHEERNVVLSRQILGSNAVCVHVRRLHGVPQGPGAIPLPNANAVDVEYYRSAIALMDKLVSDPTYFIFCDYPDWARENLDFIRPAVFMVGNGDEKNYEDLWLMSLCRHFIIANSSFSWWGAWLSKNPLKVVIATAKWYTEYPHALPSGWIVI